MFGSVGSERHPALFHLAYLLPIYEGVRRIKILNPDTDCFFQRMDRVAIVSYEAVWELLDGLDHCRSGIGFLDVEQVCETVFSEERSNRIRRSATRSGQTHGVHEQVGQRLTPEQSSVSDETSRKEHYGWEVKRAKDRQGVGQVVSPTVIKRDYARGSG
jgi:hypothetical protein